VLLVEFDGQLKVCICV